MKIENLTNKGLTCSGTGLVALDVVISSEVERPTQFYAGGSCGNVMTILSYMGWDSYPIARLSENVASELLVQDLHKWNVKSKLLTFSPDGSTPIIIHRIIRDKRGIPKHRFEFRNPEDGKYLPSYKPCLSKSVQDTLKKGTTPRVFYFDRINRAAIDLATTHKSNGAIIFFEPSSIRDLKGFNKCLEVSDIVKFSEERIPNYSSIVKKAHASIEIQTLGEEGLKYRKKGLSNWASLRGYSISNVIDSAGAGDWCTAGIINSLFSCMSSMDSISDLQLEEALKFGQILSAINCTFEGARGLMYNLNYDEVISCAESVLSRNTHNIFLSKSKEIKKTVSSNSIKISSLFVNAQ